MHTYRDLLVACVIALSIIPCARAGCMCTYNAPNDLTVRDEPYGSILGYLANDDCVVTTGITESNGDYLWLEYHYDDGSAWSASDWLQTGSNCAMPRPSLAKLHPHLARIGIDRSLNTLSILKNYTGSCSAVSMVSRAGWEARSSTLVTITTPVDWAFIHHTVTPRCYTQSDCSAIVRAMQNNHMDINNWSDIGYNFLVGDDGNMYEGRGWDKEGAHTIGYNSKSIAVAFIGNFETSSPNADMIDAVKKLLLCGQDLGYLAETYTLQGHKDVYSTLCPGIHLYDEIKTWSHYTAP